MSNSTPGNAREPALRALVRACWSRLDARAQVAVFERFVAMRFDDFDESLHPRDELGRFTDAGGASSNVVSHAGSAARSAAASAAKLGLGKAQLTSWAKTREAEIKALKPRRFEEPTPEQKAAWDESKRTFGELVRGEPVGFGARAQQEHPTARADGNAVMHEVLGERAPLVDDFERRLSQGHVTAHLHDTTMTSARYSAALDQPTLQLTLRDHKGEEAGVVDYTFRKDADGSRAIELKNAFLKEEHQSKGIGAHVMRETIRIAKDSGADKVTLEAHETGRYVWATMGFQIAPDDKLSKLGVGVGVGAVVDLFPIASTKEQYAISDRVRDAGVKDLAAMARMGPKDFGVSGKWSIENVHPNQREELEAQLTPIVRDALDKGQLGKAALLMGQPWKGQLPIKDGDPGYERAKQKLGL